MTFLPHDPKLAIAMVASCLCLITLHLLRGQRTAIAPVRSQYLQSQRQSKSIQTFRLILTMLLGFVLAVVITNGALKLFGAQRIHIVSKLISNEVAKTDPMRNQIVLVGSSQTAQGIDGVLLEKILNQDGLNFQIIQLSVPSLFNIESDFLLDEYLARTPHQPTVIFIDIGFDSEHLPAIDQRRDGLAVAATNWPHAWQRIKRSWLHYWQDIKAAGADHPIAVLSNAMKFLSDGLDSFDFFLCNVSNCAELRQLDSTVPGQYEIGTQVLFGHASAFSADMFVTPAALLCRAASQKTPTDLIEPSLGFRTWQAKKYTSMDIGIGFYYPPNLIVRSACFQKEFCERIGAYPCLTLNDTSLLVELNSYDRWYDPHHVNNLGIPIFTASLARDIEKLLTSRKTPEGGAR